jgi:hypothetical protein
VSSLLSVFLFIPYSAATSQAFNARRQYLPDVPTLNITGCLVLLFPATDLIKVDADGMDKMSVIFVMSVWNQAAANW